jgi:hypothetical protein
VPGWFRGAWLNLACAQVCVCVTACGASCGSTSGSTSGSNCGSSCCSKCSVRARVRECVCVTVAPFGTCSSPAAGSPGSLVRGWRHGAPALRGSLGQHPEVQSAGAWGVPPRRRGGCSPCALVRGALTAALSALRSTRLAHRCATRWPSPVRPSARAHVPQLPGYVPKAAPDAAAQEAAGGGLDREAAAKKADTLRRRAAAQAKHRALQARKRAAAQRQAGLGARTAGGAAVPGWRPPLPSGAVAGGAVPPPPVPSRQPLSQPWGVGR